MASVLDRVPVDAIEAQAKDIHFGRTVLTILAGILFAIGWLAGKGWFLVATAYASVKVGFAAGRNRPPDGGG